MTALIFVCNFKADSVAAFAAGACGDAAPLRTIRGLKTGLARPVGIALDRQGRLHVANGAEDAGVAVHAAHADGDVGPLRGLDVAGALRAIAIGPTGDVFVARSSRRGRPAPAVLHFAAGAARSDRALCGRRTGLTHPVALAVDAAERLIVVNGFGGIVAVYAPGAAGDVAPVRAFTPACGDAHSLAVSAGVLAVGGSCVCLYDADADAGARPRAVFGHGAGLPLRCADGLGFDCSMPPRLRIADFEADAVHLVGPTVASRLHGPATGLDGPIAVCVDPAWQPG